MSAQDINQTLQQHPSLFSFLSQKGKDIFFPKKGILAQAAQAKSAQINATLGVALEDSKDLMCLQSTTKHVQLENKDAFSYAPSFGKQELRKRWQQEMLCKNPSLQHKAVSTPIVTCALTHGLSIAGFLFTESKDSIIIPTPFWGNYKLIFSHWHSTNISKFELFDNNTFNVNELQTLLNGPGEKKIILFNFPNNPTGYTINKEEKNQIVSIIKKSAQSGKKVIVLCDDAYFGLAYDTSCIQESLFADLCDLDENVLAVKIDGATKEDYVWGLRVGFITFGCKGATQEMYQALEEKAAGCIRGNISNVAHLSQSLVLKTLESESYKHEKQEKYTTLQQRYVKIKEILASHPEYSEEFSAMPFNSGYFMCIKLQKNAETVRKVLLEKYSIGVIATGNLLRIAFSCISKDDLALLFEKIYAACKELNKNNN